METAVFDSGDLPLIEDFFVRAYTKVRIGASGERTRARVGRRRLGSMTLDNVDIGFRMNFAADPLQRVGLRRLRTGRVVEHLDGGSQHGFGPGEVAALFPDRPIAGEVAHCDHDLVLFPAALFTAVTGLRNVRLTSTMPGSPARARHLQLVLDHLYAVADDPTCAQAPLVAAAAEGLLAAAVLAAFPSTVPEEPSRADRHDAHPATLRRVMAFVESDPGRAITPADMAQAAGVGVRSVQLAFRRHLDTTPTAWLRQVRLEAAHQELAAADPNRTTVTAVAARWGFANPGRFAAAHRAAYGCSPTDTLRLNSAARGRSDHDGHSVDGGRVRSAPAAGSTPRSAAGA